MSEGRWGAIVLSLFDYHVLRLRRSARAPHHRQRHQRPEPHVLPRHAAGTLATIVVTIALVQVVGCGESPGSGDAADAAPRAPAPGETGEVTVCSPLSGTVVPPVPGEGPHLCPGNPGRRGAAVQPREGKLYAPFDGTASALRTAGTPSTCWAPTRWSCSSTSGWIRWSWAERATPPRSRRGPDSDRRPARGVRSGGDPPEVRSHHTGFGDQRRGLAAVEPWGSGGPVEAGEPLLRVRNEQNGHLEGTT